MSSDPEKDVHKLDGSEDPDADGFDLPTPTDEPESGDAIKLNQKLNFDTILNRAGFGFYHYRLFIVLGCLGIADGCESMLVASILPVFDKEFHPLWDFQSILGTTMFVGCCIGSVIAGQIVDRYGRKRPAIYSSLIMFIFGCLCTLEFHLAWFVLLKFLSGILIGIYSPIAHIIMAEVTPTEPRGKFMALLGVKFVVGQLLSCFFAVICFETIDTGDWKKFLLLSAALYGISCVLAFLWLDESARHEMMVGNYENGINILKKIYTTNTGRPGKELMTIQEQRQLIDLHKELALRERQSEARPSDSGMNVLPLFKGIYLRITPIVWFDWFTNSLTFYGVTFLLPTTYLHLNQVASGNGSVSQNTLWDLIYPCLMELPSVFVAAALVDIEGFGRKNSLFGAFFLGGLTCLLSSWEFILPFRYWISATKFFFALAFTLNYQFTSELYPTKIRGSGMGMASAFGRIGGILMPTIIVLLSPYGILMPYTVFGACALLAGLSTKRLPYDTIKMEMSENDNR